MPNKSSASVVLSYFEFEWSDKKRSREPEQLLHVTQAEVSRRLGL